MRSRQHLVILTRIRTGTPESHGPKCEPGSKVILMHGVLRGATRALDRWALAGLRVERARPVRVVRPAVSRRRRRTLAGVERRRTVAALVAQRPRNLLHRRRHSRVAHAGTCGRADRRADVCGRHAASPAPHGPRSHRDRCSSIRRVPRRQALPRAIVPGEQVLATSASGVEAPHVVLVQHWFEDLKRRAPAR